MRLGLVTLLALVASLVWTPAFAPTAPPLAIALDTPAGRALSFLQVTCRPQLTYVLDTCAPGERAVSPHSAGLTALTFANLGAHADAAAVLDWFQSRAPRPADLASQYDSLTGEPFHASTSRGEAHAIATLLLAGATLARLEPAYARRAEPWLDQLAEHLLAARRPDGRVPSSATVAAVFRETNALVAASLDQWGLYLQPTSPARAVVLLDAAERIRAILRGEVAEAGPLNRQSAADFLWGPLWGGVDAGFAARDLHFFQRVGFVAGDWGARGQPGDGFTHPVETFQWAFARAVSDEAEAAASTLATWALLQRLDGSFPEWVDVHVHVHDPTPGTSRAAAWFVMAASAVETAGVDAPSSALRLPGLLDPLDPVRTTFDLILDLSVDPPTARRLLDTAWGHVRGAASVLPVIESGDAEREAAWNHFAETFARSLGPDNQHLHPRHAAVQAIHGMVSAVNDCHTGYYPNLRAVLDHYVTEEERIGIGADLLPGGVVKRIIGSGPAESAGLQPGDTILAVDGVPFNQGGAGLLAGASGTAVQLAVRRPAWPDLLTLAPVRGPFVERFVEGRMVAPSIGYLRVGRFSEGLEHLVTPVLNDLDSQGARAWVIDLRNNGGGSVYELERLVGKFAPDQTIFWEQSRAGFVAKTSSAEQFQPGAPVVVIVNDGSYSASEVMASMLQEAGLPVVGSRTGGCVGTGQAYYLPDGAGFQVTISRMLTPSQRRNLDRLGVEPNVTAQETTRAEDLAAGRDGPLDAAVMALEKYLHERQISPVNTVAAPVR